MALFPKNETPASVAPQRTAPVAPAAPVAPVAPKPQVPTQGEAPKQENKLSALILSGPVILASDPELVKVTAPRNQRSEDQVAMDNHVKKLHAAWVAAGRPSQWPVMASKGCVATFPSAPEDVAKLKQYINRAAALHDYAIKWGSEVTVTDEFVRKQAARNVKIPAEYLGCKMISFAVKDKRDRKNTTETAQTATGQTRPESR